MPQGHRKARGKQNKKQEVERKRLRKQIKEKP